MKSEAPKAPRISTPQLLNPLSVKAKVKTDAFLFERNSNSNQLVNDLQQNISYAA